jgi:hypothetical protein
MDMTKAIAQALVDLKAYKITEDGRFITSKYYWDNCKDEIVNVIEIKTRSFLISAILTESTFDIDSFFNYYFSERSGHLKAYMYQLIK